MKNIINLKEYFEKMKIRIDDLNIRIFHFNMIQVNTLVVYDETRNGVIVDPGMSSKAEEDMLFDFIDKENIVVKYVINTHPHIDHIAGNSYCVKTFNAPLVAHKDGLPIYKSANHHGTSFGFPDSEYPMPDIFACDGDTIAFGNQIWKTLYTPGHVDGSICFYDDNHKFVIVGDVLFAGSIGRTDLPTGNFKLLIQNIQEKLLTLRDDVLVVPGHAETTTIGAEREGNPYL
ncbi:MAG: MBL fold metallo-hydrolase [Bacteroidales bacterium]|nr:MBL fold metallo-hydrolase [Bacteroidales bacterium]